MSASLAILCALAIADAPPPIETKFVQVAPLPKDPSQVEPSAGQMRAVVLIHGFRAHPFQKSKVAQAEFHDWQLAGSLFVKTLAKDSDIFAFAYGQVAAVDRIAECAGLADAIARLRKAGYTEVVLVGHSAGGVIARHFVEDRLDTGVTKVLQVCAPNSGCSLGKANIGVFADQEEFVRSLSKEGREACLKNRAEKKIPEGVEIICVVGTGTVVGDGVVSCRCQWPEDLQKQGVPVAPLQALHFQALRTQAGADKVAELIRNRQPRWNAEKVATEKKKILIDGEEKP
jgi:pimeloyl-ACP methyl ester carboxylesterase